MSKLPKNKQFIDISDYGRPVARFLVKCLMPFPIGAISITWAFTAVGFLACFFIIKQQFIIAAILLPIKSIIDAADGEMARARNQPSYVGRYLDSINDFIINGALLFSLSWVLKTPVWMPALAWLSMQLQGTLFNYYYVAYRQQVSGDTTSRLDETICPSPYPYESLIVLRILHRLYLICYGWQDALIRRLDPGLLTQSKPLPTWFMSITTVFGLGFQLVLMSLCLMWSPGVLFFVFYGALNAVLATIVVIRFVVLR